MIDEKKLIERFSHTPALTKILPHLIAIVEDQPKIGEWVPVEERLPEEGQIVLITLKHNRRKYIKKSRYSNETFWNADTRWVLFKDDVILAWMPLPEPYRPQSEPEWKGKMLNKFLKGHC